MVDVTDVLSFSTLAVICFVNNLHYYRSKPVNFALSPRLFIVLKSTKMHETSKPLFLRARDWEDEYTHLNDAELDRLIRDQEVNLREMYEQSNKSALKDALLKEPWREKEFPQVVRFSVFILQCLSSAHEKDA